MNKPYAWKLYYLEDILQAIPFIHLYSKNNILLIREVQ